MTTREAILELVLAAVQSLNEERPPEAQLVLSGSTPLFGDQKASRGTMMAFMREQTM